jgi:hypothetical protein
MKKSAKTAATSDAWEQGTLGRDEASVRRSSPTREQAVDDALGLQMISIRLPRELLSRVKLIAGYHGVAYQPLMRDVLGEPPRLSRRLHSLRGWSNGNTKSVFF